MGKGIRMIHSDCDPTLAKSKNLPYTSYLIEYLQDGMTNLILPLVINKLIFLITIGICIETTWLT